MRCDQDGPTRPTPRRRGRVFGLVALNAVLLTALGAATFAPSADAQPRTRGAYTMTAGAVNGAPSGVVYIVDTVNQELIALTYEPNQKQIQGVGYTNMAADANTLINGAQPR